MKMVFVHANERSYSSFTVNKKIREENVLHIFFFWYIFTVKKSKKKKESGYF